MNVSEIEKIMSEHLRELQKASKLCNNDELVCISSAMVRTSEFLVNLNNNHFVPNK